MFKDKEQDNWGIKVGCPLDIVEGNSRLTSLSKYLQHNVLRTQEGLEVRELHEFGIGRTLSLALRRVEHLHAHHPEHEEHEHEHQEETHNDWHYLQQGRKETLQDC